MIEEMASFGFIVRKLRATTRRFGLDIGSTSTFRHPGYDDLISDVTFGTQFLVSRVQRWKVLEDFAASDHQYISFEVKNPPHPQCSDARQTPISGTSDADIRTAIESLIHSTMSLITTHRRPKGHFATRKHLYTGGRLKLHVCDARGQDLRTRSTKYKELYHETNRQMAP